MASVQRPKSAWIAVLGGAVAAGAALLPWISSPGVSVGTEAIGGEVTGSELQMGQLVLAAGALAALAGLLSLILPKARRLWGVIVLLCGLAIVGASAWALSGAQDAYIDHAVSSSSIPESEHASVEQSLEILFSSGSLTADPGNGVYVGLAGGVVVLLGGLILLVSRSRVPESDTRAEVETPINLTPTEPESAMVTTALTPDETVPAPVPAPSPPTSVGDTPPEDEPEPPKPQPPPAEDAGPPAPPEPPPAPEPDEPRHDELGDSWSG